MTHTLTVDFVHETCCYKDCSVLFAMTQDFYNKVRNDPDHWWYCPEGHRQHYAGKSDAHRLREAEAREVALQDQLSAAIRDRESSNQVLIKERARFAAGLCPCCNRSFEALRRHMAAKHPDYDATRVKDTVVSESLFECSCHRHFETFAGLRTHQGWMREDEGAWAWDAPKTAEWHRHLTLVR